MDILIIATGEVVTEQVFRVMHSNKTLPATLNDNTLSELGAAALLSNERPQVLPTQRVFAAGAEQVNGQWQTKWIVENFPVEVATERMIAAQTTAWNNIKAERDRRRFEGGINLNGHWFLSTATATSEYNSLILMSAGLPDNTVLRAAWRTMDGATVDMTPALAKAILLTGFSHLKAIDDAAQAHRVNMEAAINPNTYDYSTGWPPIFGE